jgi:Ser/Thr protein kinase RdoA (MazF antagonist)
MPLEHLVHHFALPPIRAVHPVGSGLLHATYRVVTAGGDFVAQKLHHAIPDAAVDDMRIVTAHLRARGLQVPSLLLTRYDTALAREADGSRWRVYPWICGCVVDAVTDTAMARQAGHLVGVLHRALADLAYAPRGSMPHFHDTAFIVAELRRVRAQLPVEVLALADDILATLPALILTETSQQLVHGDLKISNLIFDAAGQAVGIIDFDTLLVHARAIDLGDALRSWCNRTAEDDPDATFQVDVAMAAEDGYAEAFGGSAPLEERALHLRATRQIALELAARCLIDVVRDDYFGFDATRYPTRWAHNIARARGQYHLAQTIPMP